MTRFLHLKFFIYSFSQKFVNMSDEPRSKILGSNEITQTGMVKMVGGLGPQLMPNSTKTCSQCSFSSPPDPLLLIIDLYTIYSDFLSLHDE